MQKVARTPTACQKCKQKKPPQSPTSVIRCSLLKLSPFLNFTGKKGESFLLEQEPNCISTPHKNREKKRSGPKHYAVPSTEYTVLIFSNIADVRH